MADTKKATGGALSKTARRSMMDTKNVQPKAIAWAWERGIHIGQGRKPDCHLFNEADIAQFDPVDWIVIKASGPWIGGSPTGGKR